MPHVLAGNAFDDGHLSLTAPIPSLACHTSRCTCKHSRRITRTDLGHPLPPSIHLFGEETNSANDLRCCLSLVQTPLFSILTRVCQRKDNLTGFTRCPVISQESWTEMWGKQIFERGWVRVDAALMEMSITGEKLERARPLQEGTKFYSPSRSVERMQVRYAPIGGYRSVNVFKCTCVRSENMSNVRTLQPNSSCATGGSCKEWGFCLSHQRFSPHAPAYLLLVLSIHHRWTPLRIGQPANRSIHSPSTSSSPNRV